MHSCRPGLASFALIGCIVALTAQAGCGGGGGSDGDAQSSMPMDPAAPSPVMPEPAPTPEATPEPEATAPARSPRPALPTASAWALVVEPGAENEAVLLRSTDDGRTWSMSAVFPGEPRRVEFAGTSGVWVVMRDSLWRTVDGGAEWVDVTDTLPLPVDPETSTELSLVGISFADEARGLVLGRHGGPEGDGRALVAITEDGGTTWSHTALETSWRVNAVCLTRNGIGVLSMFRPRSQSLVIERSEGLLRTDDYGRSWDAVTSVPIGSEYACAGESAVWISGMQPLRNEGFLGYSPDGSLDWLERDLPQSAIRLEIVSAAGPTHAWAVSAPPDPGSGLYATDDGGEKWEPLPVTALERAESVQTARFTLDGRGVAAVGFSDQQRLLVTADHGSLWESSMVPVEIQHVVDLALLP